MYFPKSKIIPNRYTEGKELIYLDTKQPYTGYYHVVADGRIYTGKTPNDGILRQLTPIVNYTDQSFTEPGTFETSPSTIFAIYDFSPSKVPYDQIRLPKTINYPPVTLIEPVYTAPTPGYPVFTRYFAKKTNNSIFVEINQTQYGRFNQQDSLVNWPAYTVFSLPWTTTGQSKEEITNTNRKITLLTEKRYRVPGLAQYIHRYDEFVV